MINLGQGAAIDADIVFRCQLKRPPDLLLGVNDPVQQLFRLLKYFYAVSSDPFNRLSNQFFAIFVINNTDGFFRF